MIGLSMYQKSYPVVRFITHQSVSQKD